MSKLEEELLIGDIKVYYPGKKIEVIDYEVKAGSLLEEAQELLGDKLEDFKEYVDGIHDWDMSDVKRYLNR